MDAQDARNPNESVLDGVQSLTDGVAGAAEELTAMIAVVGQNIAQELERLVYAVDALRNSVDHV